MKRLTTLFCILSLAFVAVPAAAHTQTGSGTSPGGPLTGYDHCEALTAITPGTNFELTTPSDDGDWDAFFYDGNGNDVGAFQAFGDEDDVVPANAASGEVCMWSTDTPDNIVEDVLLIVNEPAGTSNYCYADGLDYGSC